MKSATTCGPSTPRTGGRASTSAFGAVWPRWSITAGGASSCSTCSCSPCPAPRSSTTVTRSPWATTSTSATATGFGRRCSGPATATRASPPRTQRLCTRRSSWTRCTVTRRSTSRRRHPVFGRGTLEFLHPDNRQVLAYLREYEGVTILCVVNLSRFSQYVELDLRRYDGRVPVELVGHVRFPAIGELPYLLTFGPHGFYWFLLTDGS